MSELAIQLTTSPQQVGGLFTVLRFPAMLPHILNLGKRRLSQMSCQMEVAPFNGFLWLKSPWLLRTSSVP